MEQVTGRDSGRLTAVVNNCIGSDQSSTNVCVEDVPGIPVGKPHIYGINRESASISWCGPSSSPSPSSSSNPNSNGGNGGGSPSVSYYVIEAKTRQQTTWDVLVPQCKELSYHVFGLEPSVTYQFRVRAANKEGLGPPSEPSERVITSDPFSPSLDEMSDGNSEVFTPTVEYRRADELPFEPRDVQINKTDMFEDMYDLGPVVGKGKFGVVYKCVQKSDGQGRTWAAKVLKCREKDKVAVRQELAIMNKLRHPKLLMLWDAFESPRQMVLVMEFIGAGELFERVIGEDFVLTERDCVHFVRQICEGVSYMHTSHVLHLDLKPENILCIAENSNRIKIIDFGLARFFSPGDSTKVLLGTPEFIAPEVINYDEIGLPTDMWSIGVICYVLLSGLSPFLGDNDVETLSNVTVGEFDFDDEAFDEISDDAKDFISSLLIKRKEKRLLTEACLNHPWLAGDEVDGMRYKRLNTDRLKHFMVRRKWLKTGNAVLAVSRLMKTTSLSSFGSRNNSSSSSSSIVDAENTTTTSPHTATSDDSDCSPSSLPAQQNGTSDTESSSIYKDQNDNKLLITAAGDSSSPSPPKKTQAVENGDGVLPPQPSTMDNDSSSSNTTGDRDGSDSMKNSQHKEISNSSTDVSSSSLMSSSSTITTTTPASSTNSISSFSSSLSSSSTLCSSSTLSSSPPPPPPTTTTTGPYFTKEMSDSKACIGDSVRFDVAVTGLPVPEVVWYFEEEKLASDAKYSIEINQSKGTCSLIIRSIEDEDDGEYVCRAVNESGEAVCSADLSVLEL